MKKRIADLIEELTAIENTHRHYVFGVSHIHYREPMLYITDEVQFRITSQVSEEQRERILKHIRHSYENIVAVNFNELYSLIVALFSEKYG